MKTSITLKISFYLVIVLLGFTANGQTWSEMIKKENVNYYKVVEENDKYYATHFNGRGSGYKQYQRWKYFTKRIIDDKGNIPTESNFLEAKEAFDKKFRKNKTASATTGDWKELGPFAWRQTGSWNPGVGRITALAVEKNQQQLMFAGSPGGGIWRSKNAAQNWEPLGDRMSNMNVFGVGIDPFNNNVIYLINGAGRILKSTNQGDSWSEIFNTGSGVWRNMSIVFHPNNPGTLLVASSSGVWKSTNSGASFYRVLSTYVEDIAYRPGDPNTVYACGNKFYKSYNGGDSFFEKNWGIVSTERLRLAVTPANNNYVYLVQKSGDSFGHFYRSTNSGEGFSERLANNTPYFSYARRDMAIMVSSTNADEVHVAGMNNHRSRDGGSNFETLSTWSATYDPSYIHADVEIMMCVNDIFYAGSDGGVFRSNNHGDNYTDLSSLGGLAVHQFYRIAGTPQDANMIIGGSQDNGVNIMKNKEGTWNAWLGADGMECFIDPSNKNIVYGMTQYGGINKSTNGGANRVYINKPVSGDGNWVTPFFVDPSQASNIYAGYDGLYRSKDRGNNWSKISNSVNTGGNLDEATIAPSNNNYIYMARENSFWRTTNGQSENPTWNLVNGFSGNVNFIAVDPNDPARVAIACNGSRVYVSTNAGSNWSSRKMNLPNSGAECVAFDDSDNNGLYIGTANAIYYTNDNLNSWQPFSEGLPATAVRDLEINFTARKVRAGTHGRGLFESFLYNESRPLSSTGLVTVYEDCNLSGFSGGFGIGDYTTSDMVDVGVSNDWISSLKVTEGYKTTLYADDDFGGASVLQTANNNCFSNNWNDRVSSVKVRPNGEENKSGTYFIKNKETELYIDVAGGSTANGAAITQATFNGNFNQRFELTDRGDGSYTISARHSNKVMDVSGRSTQSGGIIHQWTDGEGANKRFILYPTNNGYYKLIAEHSAMVAGVSTNDSGEQLRQYENHNEDNAQWELIEVPAPTTDLVTVYEDCNHSGFSGGLSVGEYSKTDLLAIGLRDNQASSLKVTEGYKITLYADDNFGGASVLQTTNNNCFSSNWNDRVSSVKVRPNGEEDKNGTYFIKNKESELYIDVAGGSTANAAPIIQSAFNGNFNQRFELTDRGDGSYTISALHSNKVMDVSGSGVIHQWTDGAGANKRFILYPTNNGYYKLIAEHSGMIAGVSTNDSGEQLRQYENHNEDNAQWELIEVPAPTTGLVTVYEDCNHSGFSGGLSIGEYSKTDLLAIGLRDNQASSLKVTEGYKITMYADDNFGGASVLQTTNSNCFSSNWNDRVSSVKVRPNGEGNKNGTYFIKNKESELYIDVAGGSTANGTAITQATFNGNLNQRFELTDRGDGSYTISAQHSSKAMGIKGISTQSGGVIHQWEDKGENYQRFILYPTGNGYYKLIAEHSGMVAEVSTNNSGEQLYQSDNHNGDNAQWELVEVPAPTTGLVTLYDDCNHSGFSGGLSIREYSKTDLLAIGLRDNQVSSLKVTEGYKITLYADDNFGGASVLQTNSNSCFSSNWNDRVSSVKVRPNGEQNKNGTYFIKNKETELYIDVAGGSTANATPIIQSAFNGSLNQQFELTDRGDGSYTILAQHSSKAMGVKGISTQSGGVIHQWEDKDENYQRFILYPNDGYYKLIAEHSGMVAEVLTNDSGEQLHQSDNHNGDNAQWELQFASVVLNTTKSIEFEPVSIYPNPASSNLHIHSTEELISVEIYNLTGKLLIQGKEDEVSIEDIDQGTYIIKVVTPSHTQTIHFSIVK